jgi:hypothetical protein
MNEGASRFAADALKGCELLIPASDRVLELRGAEPQTPAQLVENGSLITPPDRLVTSASLLPRGRQRDLI